MKELNDEELLEILMTSEFNDELTPDEFRFLLFKFRNFYRYLYGKHGLLENESGHKIDTLQNDLNGANLTIENMLVEKDKIDKKLSYFKKRKLSLSERIKGRIDWN